MDGVTLKFYPQCDLRALQLLQEYLMRGLLGGLRWRDGPCLGFAKQFLCSRKVAGELMEPEALYLRLLGLSRLGLSENLGNSLKSNASSILIIISLAISWPYIRPYHMFLDSVITILNQLYPRILPLKSIICLLFYRVLDLHVLNKSPVWL